MKVYLLTYSRPFGFDPAKLASFISGQKDIEDWWHYLDSAYLLLSRTDLQVLSNRLAVHFNGLPFILIPVSLANVNGLLPQDAWTWINQRKHL